MKQDSAIYSRSRRLINGIATSALARVIALASPLLTMPLTFEALNPASFGIWMTAQSMASMLLWADLGLGNGLLTQLTASVANRDATRSHRLVASAYFALAKVAVVGCFITVMVMLTPISSLVGLNNTESNAIVAIALVAFFVNVPLSLVQRIQYAVGEIALSNVLSLAGPVLAVVGAYACALNEAPALVMVLVIAFAQPVSSLIATGVTAHRHPSLIPRLTEFRIKLPRSLLTLGSGFVVIQILSSILNNLDNPLITATLGPEATSEYAIVARAFSVLGLAVSLMNLPLWPATAEAIALGDEQWVRRTTNRMIIANLAIMAVATILAIILADDLIRFWMGGDVETSVVLVLGFCAYWAVIAGISPLLMVQNAVGLLRWQAIGLSACVAISIIAKLLIVQTNRDLLPIVACAAYILVMLPMATVGYKQTLKRIRGKVAS